MVDLWEKMTGLSSSVILTLSQAPPGPEVRMLARELPQQHWGTWRMGFPKSITDRIRKATAVQRKSQSQLERLSADRGQILYFSYV